MVRILSDSDKEKALAKLAGWSLSPDGTTIMRHFVFRDFIHAFSFMTQAALVAERMNHHPQWSNVWNRVEVSLTTHDAGGLTQKDIALAQAMDEAVGRT